MSTIGQSLLKDIKEILGRPVFSADEEELLAMAFDDKIGRAFDISTERYRNEIKNLKDLMDFSDSGGDFFNLWDGE